MKRNSDPWLRFYVRTLNNPKVQRLPGSIFKGWVNLLCLAKETDGVLPAVEDISFRLRLSKSKAESLLSTLETIGLIDGDRMHDWDEMQYSSDSSTERVKRHRERNMERSSNVSSNVSETVQSRTEQNRNRNIAEEPPISPKGDGTPAHRIFTCWNSHDALIHHQNLNPRFRKPINARLKDGYSEADLCKAIGEYARLCQIGQAPGHNKWTLAELMSRGQGDWLDKILNGNGAITGAHSSTSKSQTAMEETQKNMEVFLGNRPPKTRALI